MFSYKLLKTVYISENLLPKAEQTDSMKQKQKFFG